MKRLSLILATATLVLFSSSLAISPAQAHDEVSKITPAADSVIEAGYNVVLSVTFNETIMDVGGGKGVAFALTGPDGSDLSTGCLTVAGSTMSTMVDLDQPGKYQVKWRSVSMDGHANSGSYGFTLANTSGYVSAGTIECETFAGVGVNLPSASAEAKNDGLDFSINGLGGLLIGIGLFVVISILGFINVERRNKKARRKQEEDRS